MGKGMVKCLICGAVFEEGVEVCPVCGVGPENFVAVEPERTRFIKNTDERFVILGTGTAALSAATAIRERNACCHIVMISNERALPYHRPMLTKNLLLKGGRNSLDIHGPSWYRERNIRLITDEIVSSLDPERKLVGLSNDTGMPYDKCIYALGASSFVPPFPGADLPEVLTIRTLEDVERVNALLPGVNEAVVIGGGVLGFEAAWELVKAGKKVSVLETAGRLLSRQLDEQASGVLLELAEANGVTVRLSAATERIAGKAHVEGVTLKDGRTLPAQMVIISTGVRANTRIALEAGVAVQRAVVVNEFMETSAPDVYACGDCAEFQGVNYGVWPEATRMGEVAGANAAGERTAYVNPLPALTLSAMNTSLFAIGDMGTKPGAHYQISREYDEHTHRLKTEYRLDGKLVGGILIGDLSGMEALQKAVAGQA